MNKIKIKHVQSFYNENYSPTVSNITVVGDISKDELLPKLDFLNKWKKKTVNIFC